MSLVVYLLAARAWGGEHVYAEAGAAHEHAVLLAPLAPGAATAFAVTALDALRRALVVPGGRLTFALAAPASAEPPWRGPAAAPFVAAAPEGARVAVLLVRARFRVGEELPRLRVLRLRADYADGLIVRLNGVEVARRRLPEADTDPWRFAAGARPTEPETLYVPVVAGLLRPGENVLELEVRPAARRRSPQLAFELRGAEEPRIVRGPLLARAGAREATIVVETDVPVAVEVRHGGAVGPLGRRVTGAAATRHELRLEGLAPGAPVRYQVVTPFETTAEAAFRAAPADGAPVRFAVYGDPRSGHARHAEVLAAIAADAPDFLVSTGDLVVAGDDEGAWQTFFAVAGATLARLPLIPARGNHDEGAGRRFEQVFAFPPPPADRPDGAAWTSTTVAGVHLAILDSARYAEPSQLSWLDADLAAARAAGARALIVVTHRGFWSRGPHGGDGEAGVAYAPVLARHGVAVVFSGHDHFYERGRASGVDYVVTAGGGAPLYRPRCGERGRPACPPDGARFVAAEHHYVLVEVDGTTVRLCPRRLDRTPLEPCVRVGR